MLGDAKLAADFADDMLGKCFLYRFYYKKYPKIYTVYIMLNLLPILNSKRNLRHRFQLPSCTKRSSENSGTDIGSSYERRY